VQCRVAASSYEGWPQRAYGPGFAGPGRVLIRFGDQPTGREEARSAPSLPGGATGLTGMGGAGLAGPNSSSAVLPSARDSANATRRDCSDRPDSTLETACRDTPAILATAYWDSSRAWRMAGGRAPVVVSCASVTLQLPPHRASCGRPRGPVLLPGARSLQNSDHPFCRAGGGGFHRRQRRSC
jgi:hypothetical protein